jgi:hypothetical protein
MTMQLDFMNDSSAIDIEASTGAVRAEIEFLQPPSIHDRAYCYAYDPGPHEPPPTAGFAPHSVVVRNARTEPGPLSLDEHGATLIEHRSTVQDFYDSEELTDVYYPEAAAAIKATTGADWVVVFDHNIRRGLSLSLRADRYRQGRPVLHAHTDFTERSAVRRLRDHLGSKEVDLRGHRLLQVNLWRPIRGPLRDFPLAICDASSIHRDELVPVDLLYPGRRGEIYYLSYASTQRWFYAPDMQTHEAWLIKNYDSAENGIARFAAHSAFNEPSRGVRVDPRESIEVRAFALLRADLGKCGDGTIPFVPPTPFASQVS